MPDELPELDIDRVTRRVEGPEPEKKLMIRFTVDILPVAETEFQTAE